MEMNVLQIISEICFLCKVFESVAISAKAHCANKMSKISSFTISENFLHSLSDKQRIETAIFNDLIVFINSCSSKITKFIDYNYLISHDYHHAILVHRVDSQELQFRWISVFPLKKESSIKFRK